MERLEKALTEIFFYKTIFWLVTFNLIIFTLIRLKKRDYKVSLAVLALTVAYHVLAGRLINEKCVVHYYTVFQNQSVAEEYIVQPIEQAGKAIGPILTKKILEKDLKYRLYAMLGLQIIGYKPAAYAMEKILVDTSENYSYRAKAYEVLRHFNDKSSQRAVHQFERNATDSVDLKVIELGEYFFNSK